jgi:uncharacterized membrane protein SpoIIM required for sporulation
MLDGFGGTRGTLASAWIVARRELRDQLRDWRIISPIVLLTLFFPMLMNLTARQVDSFVSRYGATIIGERLMPFLLMIVGFFPISISLVIALESFAGERERLSLEPLLATPLKGEEIFIGKVLASLSMPLLGAFLGIVVYLISLAVRIGWYPTPELLLQVIALTTGQAVMMVSAAVVVSSQATSVRAANLLASFIIVPVSELIIAESMIMFWGRNIGLWLTFLGLVVVSVIFWRMGLHLFNREQLLSREIDRLDLRWAWTMFWRAFRGDARGPIDWFVGVWRRSLPGLWRSGIAMILLLAGGFCVGVLLAHQFTLPANLLNLSILRGGGLGPLQEYGLMSARGWLWVMFTNMRALLIATALGIFSLGVFGMILLMAPIGIIGYLTANLALAGQDAGLFMAALVLPHGILEIPLTIVAGAALLEVALSMVNPRPGISLGESWITGMAEWARITLAVSLPLLVGAAALEVFLTPRIGVLLLGGG